MSATRLFLAKYGEIALKKGNRPAFTRRLRISIQRRLPGAVVHETWHRVFVECPEEYGPRAAEELARTFGIVSFSEAVAVEKDIALIREAAARLAEAFVAAGRGTTFKLDVRRADKSFPRSSYQLACELGDLIRQRVPGLTVDVHQPGWVMAVEVRERVYLYGPETRGPGGLPTGSSGTGMLLLSGGIDSPVAGWLMAKRGLALEAAYFHTPPFTSEGAREKVVELARMLGSWAPGVRLHVVPLTPVLARIRERAPEEETTLLMRAAMMSISQILARRTGAACLVTGESLGQVASQTVESMQFTGSLATVPVFRPLCGLDKEEIVALARRIGTFDVSNRPYDDCCVLFSPKHPLIKPAMDRMKCSWEKLEVDGLLAEAAERAETLTV